MNKITKLFQCLSNPKFYNAYLYGVSPLFELTPLVKQINNAKTLIEVDGGVNANNYMKLRSLGADVLVAGSYIFNSEDDNEVIKKLKE